MEKKKRKSKARWLKIGGWTRVAAALVRNHNCVGEKQKQRHENKNHSIIGWWVLTMTKSWWLVESDWTMKSRQLWSIFWVGVHQIIMWFWFCRCKCGSAVSLFFFLFVVYSSLYCQRYWFLSIILRTWMMCCITYIIIFAIISCLQSFFICRPKFYFTNQNTVFTWARNFLPKVHASGHC